MKINEVTFQMERDFSAVMECEHCGNKQMLHSGYNDGFYHQRVIPAMTCESCGKNREGIIPEIKNDNGLKSVSTEASYEKEKLLSTDL
jgi:C4-type Zn-finger protein